MKTLDFKHHGHLPIPFKNTPRSKALEPVCLSRSHLPPFVTQSLEGEGRGGGQLRGKFTQKIEVCQQKRFPNSNSRWVHKLLRFFASPCTILGSGLRSEWQLGTFVMSFWRSPSDWRISLYFHRELLRWSWNRRGGKWISCFSIVKSLNIENSNLTYLICPCNYFSDNYF